MFLGHSFAVSQIRPPAGGGAVVGGAALLEGEANGFAVDCTYAVDAQRVAVKVAGAVTAYALDTFFSNTALVPKQVYDVSGALVWSPHNLFLNSGVPVTQSVTLIIGMTYTVSVVGSGSLAGTVGASGTATDGSPATFVATGTSGTFTKTGTLTQMQINRGPVATAYLVTAGANPRNGLAIDYDPVTHALKGVLGEGAATNLLLNNAALSTQSVTVTAVAHTLSFWGTGTITLSGVSTAGPLVGTGASNRVSLTFTPTAGSLTCTVSGTVSRAQLEIGSFASSPIQTFGVTQTRTADLYAVTPASINYSATAGSWWVEFALTVTPANNRVIGYTTTTTPLFVQNTTTISLFDTATALTKTVATVNDGLPRKAACAFQSGSRAVTANGLAASTDAGTTTNLLSPGVAIYFGTGGGFALNGYVRKAYYLPRRMTNTELQDKTV